MHRVLYLLLLAGYLMVACRTGKSDQPATNRRLVFGEGGGFTGAVTTYTLQADGQLQRINSLTQETGKAGSVSRKEAADFFARAESLIKANPDFNHPGNHYFFVKLEDGNAGQGVTWGDNAQPVPAGVEALYDELIKHTNP
jgi:hypothetical protein